MASKKKRLLIGIPVTIILVPVILVLVGLMFLPKDKVRELIVKEVTAATGAEVSLGEASVHFWPKLGVTLDEGRINGTGAALMAATGAQNNLDTYAMDLKQLTVFVALGPLLKKNIQIDSINISGPTLSAAWEKGEVLVAGYNLEIRNVKLPIAAAQVAGQAAAASSGEKKRPTGEMIPAQLVCDFTAQIDQIISQKVPYNNLKMEGELDSRVLTITKISTERSTGQISGEAEIDWDQDPWGKLDFDVTAADVPANQLLEPWAPSLAAKFEGILNAQAAGRCDLKDALVVRQTLDITGTMSAGEGVLHAQEWLKEVVPYLGNRQDLQDIRYNGLAHRFRLEKGRYLVEELHIDGVDTDWSTTGWISLEGNLDLAVLVKLPEGFTPDLGQWAFLADSLRDESGRVNLDLNLTGRAAKPTVGVDLGQLKKVKARDAAEVLKKGLGGLLDKWKTK